MNNEYIKDLIYLRQTLDNIIDNGIYDAMRGRASSKSVHDSIEYRNGLFFGKYPDSKPDKELAK